MTVSYRNPVHDTYFADPFVLRVGDEYVAFGTGGLVDGRAFEVLTSPDLVSWHSAGGALEPLATEAGTDYWAPEVIAADGRWWMYYSVGHGDVGHHLRVAMADTVAGPYHDCGVNLTPHQHFAIDPSPFRDEDGTTYLFFAVDVLGGDRVGTMLACDVLLEPTRLAGEARIILRPSADWQLFMPQRAIYGAVYAWHTLEGPFVIRHGGRYYCFYSGGSWREPGYRVAYAVSDHPLGPWLEPPGGQPLLETVPDRVIGPGHCSILLGPDGQHVMAYHAWDPARTARRMCIDPIAWTPVGPRVLGPTWQPTQLPRSSPT